MKHYELLFVIKPTLTEEEIAKQISNVTEHIKELGGEVVATNEMGMRKLAYEINKHPRGYYVVVYHKSPTSSIAEIERRLRYNEDILRFLTIKYENKKEIAEFQKQVDACGGKSEEQKEEASSEA
jgi:small subunit ribosomal protein S6